MSRGSVQKSRRKASDTIGHDVTVRASARNAGPIPMSRDRSQPSAECIATNRSLVEDHLGSHRGGTDETRNVRTWSTKLRRGGSRADECCRMCCELRHHVCTLSTCRVRTTRKAKETRPAEGTGWTPFPSAASGLSVALSAAALSSAPCGPQASGDTSMYDKIRAACGSGESI